MYIAVEKNNNRISIENTNKDTQYYCPICGEPLIIRATDSLAVRQHFAHKRGTKCSDDFSHDMSEWHYNWQKSFPEECREVVVEKDGVKHRADVLIGDIVIEFQHSPITAEEISKRNNFYLSCGYKVVWVFDAEGEIKHWLDGSIDPMKCSPEDLCWKRAKRQFIDKIPQNVNFFFEYKSFVSNRAYLGQLFDIMILVKEPGPKNIVFYPTRNQYILPSNFIKHFGGYSNKETNTLDEIFNRTL